jgi:hypothetical protein
MSNAAMESEVTLTVPVCPNCTHPVLPNEETGEYRGATCHRVCALELWVEELRGSDDQNAESASLHAFFLSTHQRRPM